MSTKKVISIFEAIIAPRSKYLAMPIGHCSQGRIQTSELTVFQNLEVNLEDGEEWYDANTV